MILRPPGRKERTMYFDSVAVEPLSTNCYLIGDETEKVCAVVDPGGSPELVLDMIQRSGMKLTMILATHGHFDHVRAIPEILVEYPDVPVYIHEQELCQPENWDKRLWLVHQGENQRTYNDGDTLMLGSIPIHVMFTPGHSAGSVVLLAEDYMLSGDTLFAGTCGRWDLFGGSSANMMASLARLGSLQKNYKVYPGHGRPSTLDLEKRTNDYVRQAMA